IQSLAETIPPTDAQAKEVIRLLADADGIAPFVRSTDGDRLLTGEWVFDPVRSRGLEIGGDIRICDTTSSDGEKWYDEVIGVQTLKRLGELLVRCKPMRQFDHAFYLRLMGEDAKM